MKWQTHDGLTNVEVDGGAILVSIQNVSGTAEKWKFEDGRTNVNVEKGSLVVKIVS